MQESAVREWVSKRGAVPGAEEEDAAGDDEEGGGHDEEHEEDVLRAGQVEPRHDDLGVVGRVEAGVARR